MWKHSSSCLIALLAVSGAAIGQTSPVEPNVPAGSGTNAGAPELIDRNPGREGVIMECPPSGDEKCPPPSTSGSSVTTTDDLPLGSTVRRDEGQQLGAPEKSQYPTPAGVGTMSGKPPDAPGERQSGPITGTGR